MRKLFFRLWDQVGHKPGRAVKFRTWGKKRDCNTYIAKTKALISCAVTAQLICTLVFVYAKSRFSHAHSGADLE